MRPGRPGALTGRFAFSIPAIGALFVVKLPRLSSFRLLFSNPDFKSRVSQ